MNQNIPTFPSIDEPTTARLEIDESPTSDIVVDNSNNNPTPAIPQENYVRYGKSIVYHLPTHYKNKEGTVPVTSLDNLIMCKFCKKTLEKGS
jgi:hypothetical protein